MIVEKDVAVPAGDGTVLRANIYRPAGTGRCPVIMAMGIYGKDVHFADAYRPQWEVLTQIYPGVCANGSSGAYLRWENADPERWVPDGYVVLTVDSRGSGKSPGYLDPFSPRETQDFYDAIEWAAMQPWSNGHVGLLGISYFSIKQWQVAARRPPHLRAICPWEGGCDLYRDWSHHGGILSNLFPTAWYPRQVLPNQHGNAATHHRDRATGERTTGEALSPALLEANRADHASDLLAHPLDDAWYAQRSPKLDRIDVPLYSAGNWGGTGLHLRGNIEGYLRASSPAKWLEVHVGTHFETFYLPDYLARQKRFFDRYLKGERNGWESEPTIRLAIRRPDGAAFRSENEWPLARTIWTRYFLDASDKGLARAAPVHNATQTYVAQSGSIDFRTAPFARETEFTGPLAARLWMSSATTDADIFPTLRLLDPAGNEVMFTGASEKVPVTRGWLRASHRKLDPALSAPWRPYLAHDEIQKLTPGQIYPLDIEIWPTSVVCPPGFVLVLTIAGHDHEFAGVPGRMLHNHPADRPPAECGGAVTIHTGPGFESYLLLPLIPAAR